MCDIASETLEVVDGIPSHYSPAQVLWSKDGNDIYGVVFENEPRRLGLIYCTNRESYIFCLDSKGEFSKSYQFIYLLFSMNWLFDVKLPSFLINFYGFKFSKTYH
mgnify:FL=1